MKSITKEASSSLSSASSLPLEEHDVLPVLTTSYLQHIYQRYNVVISLLTPAVIVYSIWIYFMIVNDKFQLYTTTVTSTETSGWYMAIMIFVASIIQGLTSGGGSVMSIPMLSYLLDIPISISGELSFMIQSIGLAATACSMLYMKIAIEKDIVIYSSIGSVVGVICGLGELYSMIQ